MIQFLAIDRTAVVAPTAAVESAAIDLSQTQTELNLEVWGNQAFTIDIQLRGPDGVFRTAQTIANTVQTANTLNVYAWPMLLGVVKIILTAAAAGWNGYATLRIS